MDEQLKLMNKLYQQTRHFLHFPDECATFLRHVRDQHADVGADRGRVLQPSVTSPGTGGRQRSASTSLRAGVSGRVAYFDAHDFRRLAREEFRGARRQRSAVRTCRLLPVQGNPAILGRFPPNSLNFIQITLNGTAKSLVK
jgi:hypothetical protein